MENQCNWIKEAAEAHSTLNTFASLVAILEGGLVYCPSSYSAVSQIIDIAKIEQQRLLRKYDRAVAMASRQGGA